MTYCAAIRVNEGLVFAADTRTSAGVDDVRTYNKLHPYELDNGVFVILSAGNLATTQSVLAQLQRDLNEAGAKTLATMRHMYDAAEYLGQLVVAAQRQIQSDGSYTTVDFRTTLILGGQVRGEAPALYLVYPEGNCISTSPETPYLQIGEHKYGKPILDRIIRSDTPLEDAARCVLVSLDSTMKSSLSVGPPLDLVLIPTDTLQVGHRLRLDFDTPYYARLKEGWSRSIQTAFRDLPRFEWELARDPAGSAAINTPARPGAEPLQQQAQQSQTQK